MSLYPRYSPGFRCTGRWRLFPKQPSVVICTYRVGVDHAAAATATLAQEVPTGKQKVRKYENGFQVEDLAMGQPDGPLAKPGQKVFVKYRGSLTNGKVFDETKGKSTFGFRLGEPLTPSL